MTPDGGMLQAWLDRALGLGFNLSGATPGKRE